MEILALKAAIFRCVNSFLVELIGQVALERAAAEGGKVAVIRAAAADGTRRCADSTAHRPQRSSSSNSGSDSDDSDVPLLALKARRYGLSGRNSRD
jgi:hypothetical protein